MARTTGTTSLRCTFVLWFASTREHTDGWEHVLGLHAPAAAFQTHAGGRGPVTDDDIPLPKLWRHVLAGQRQWLRIWVCERCRPSDPLSFTELSSFIVSL